MECQKIVKVKLKTWFFTRVLMKIVQKNSFPPKKVLKRVPKKGSKKSSRKSEKKGLKKVQIKVMSLLKALKKEPKKVFFLRKVQKRAL